jgi:hypothetical protein
LSPFFQATRKTYPGFGYWTAGIGILALRYLLYALRGLIPLWVSVFLGTAAKAGNLTAAPALMPEFEARLGRLNEATAEETR